jgi:SecD/SecF fusion protein
LAQAQEAAAQVEDLLNQPSSQDANAQDTTPADTTPADTTPEGTTPADRTPEDTTPGESQTDVGQTPAETSAADAPSGQLAGEQSTSAGVAHQMVQTVVNFDEAITAETVKRVFRDAAAELGLPMAIDPRLAHEGWTGNEAEAYSEWAVELPLRKADAERLLEHVASKMSQQPVWLSSSTFGGAVATTMQLTAYKAMGISLIGIIAYVWVRFHRLSYGVAGVVALIHDVFVMLAGLSLSHWLASALGFLLIEDFRISLPVVAAMLTIVGYSINDTIVVFDRMRDVRGRNPNVTEEMINTTVNQTLNRTILTSFTTLLVVIVLYALGGAGIHPFAFVLLVGVVAGTYSTVYIASPVLLWLTPRVRDRVTSTPRTKATV